MAKVQKQFFLSQNDILYADKQKNAAEKKAANRKPGGGKKSQGKKVYNCATCGLSQQCRNPNMPMIGEGKKGILIVGESPSVEGDSRDIPITGSAGTLLRNVLKENGIDMDKDCICTNAVRCCAEKPAQDQVKACTRFLLEEIAEIKPKLIITLGAIPLKVLFTTRALGKGKIIDKMHGWTFPVQELNCWVGCSFHPKFIGYKASSEDEFASDLHDILQYLDKPLAKPLDPAGNICISDANDAMAVFEEFSKLTTPVGIDYESTCISPYDEGATPLTVALSKSTEEAYCIHLANPEWSEVEQSFVSLAFQKFLGSSVPKVIQNNNMEECWSRVHFNTEINNLIMDTMVAWHVVHCRRGTTSQDYQVYKLRGHYYSDAVNKRKMAEEPFSKVGPYNCFDARYNLVVYEYLRGILDQPGNEKLSGFYDFLHGALYSCANMRHRGVLVDQAEAERLITQANSEIDKQTLALFETKAGIKFRETYGHDINIGSPIQMAQLFYTLYNEKTRKMTGKGNYCMDAGMMEKINCKSKLPDIIQFTSLIRDKKRPESMLKKLLEYKGYIGYDGRIHASTNLNVAETFRSSIDSPNLQNMFKHDKLLKPFRRIIIPRRGNKILEPDYAGLEMRVAAMVSDDPVLRAEIQADIDTHRKWTALLLSKPEEDVTKDERFAGKNNFVFASLYGSLPDPIAMNMKLPVEHVKAVQEQFWTEYHYIKEWQLKTMAEYQKNGYVEAVSGFRRPGPLTVEKVFNTPIQGPAFHLLLDSLVRMDAFFIEEGFESFIYSEIHDSMEIDAVPEEIPLIVEVGNEIMTMKRFDWQGDVPLGVEWDIGDTFYGLKKLKI